jgi:hypothetical protein
MKAVIIRFMVHSPLYFYRPWRLIAIIYIPKSFVEFCVILQVDFMEQSHCNPKHIATEGNVINDESRQLTGGTS